MAGNRAAKTKIKVTNLKGDYGNIAFLLLLYILQGIPIGLSGAVPLLMQNRKVSYTDQALFSFVTWPFSLKLFWAPIVDSLYWKKVGRRKSWLIPVQLLIGLFMIILSRSVQSLLSGDPELGLKPDIRLLTVIFLMLNFLAATQDIAVDGWALTLLSRRNVGYASTCNTAGQTAGYFIGNVIFLALESADFSNRYLRSDANQSPLGVVTFEGYLYNCGLGFIVITTLVAILKREHVEKFVAVRSDDPEVSFNLTRTPRKPSPISVKTTDDQKGRSSVDGATRNENDNPDDNDDSDEVEEQRQPEEELSVKETYALLYKIMKLPSFKLLAVVLLTCKIGFAAPDAISGLKLVEAGVKKENLAMLAVPMVPIQIILPWYLSRVTCGPRPLDLLIKAYPYRLLFGILFPLVVLWTPSVVLADSTFPFYYYLVILIVYALHQVTVYSIFVALMAFHAAISDPSIGGTYMTLLNTITNFGGNWPSTLSLWLVERLTFQKCSQVCKTVLEQSVNGSSTVSPNGEPAAATGKLACHNDCTTLIDGYYIECAFCVVIGFLWLRWGGNKLRRLQSLSPVAWSVSGNKSN